MNTAPRHLLPAGRHRLDAAPVGADCLGGEAILAGGERTGAVSSGAWGPSVGASLEFGYVRPEHAAPGTELEVLVPGERRPARVLAEARHDPGNLRPRS